MSELALLRLASQRLVGLPVSDPREVVRRSGAVQAQDYPAAKWAVAQRTEAADEGDLDRAFNAGDILRTHMLRPTWHFVAPEDIRWIQELTGPRVDAANGFIKRQQGLDDRLLSQTSQLIGSWLSGGVFLTRTEVATRLEDAGIPAAGVRLAYILMHAELNAVVCSGPLRGRQHTYALLEERVPAARRRVREEALAELAERYFTSHGPAQLQDMAWWSGLTIADVRAAVQHAGPRLECKEFDGKTHWSGAAVKEPAAPATSAHLLPNYDEYFIALKDRSALFNPSRTQITSSEEGILDRHILVAGGDIVGGWRSSRQSNRLTVRAKLTASLQEAEREALAAAAERYGRFLGAPTTAVFEE